MTGEGAWEHPRATENPAIHMALYHLLMVPPSPAPGSGTVGTSGKVILKGIIGLVLAGLATEGTKCPFG
jgi:hypothetical protein